MRWYLPERFCRVFAWLSWVLGYLSDKIRNAVICQAVLASNDTAIIDVYEAMGGSHELLQEAVRIEEANIWVEEACVVHSTCRNGERHPGQP